MNELLAIVLIVVLCCLMFIAWLVSMATCPDAMVGWLSGTRTENDSPYASKMEARELLVNGAERGDKEQGAAVSSVYNIASATRRASDKKLSVVPEADEQLTVQSTVHSLRPTILRPTIEMKEEESAASKGDSMA